MPEIRDAHGDLFAELARLLVLLRAAVLELRAGFVPGPDTAPLAILGEEIDWHLARPLAPRPAGGPEVAALLAEADASAGVLAAQTGSRAQVLARRLGLDRRELDALLLVLAPDMDPRFERIFGYLHDDLTRRRASAGLLLRVLARDAAADAALRRSLERRGALMRDGLVRRLPDPDGGLLTEPLAVDERLGEFLRGEDGLDPRLERWARREGGAPGLGALSLPRRARERLTALGACWRQGHVRRSIYLHGPPGSGRVAALAAVSAELGSEVLRVATAGLLREPEERFAGWVDAIRREALLGDRTVVWEDADSLSPEQRALILRRGAAEPPIRAAFVGAEAWSPAGADEPEAVALVRPGFEERRAVWQAALGRAGAALAATEVAELIGGYDLAPGAIHEAVEAAASAAREREGELGARGPKGDPTAASDGGSGDMSAETGAEDAAEAARRGPAPGVVRLTRGEVDAAVRRQTARSLAGLARPLAPRSAWDDLVLPADRKEALAELCRHARHRERVLGAWGFRRGLAAGRGQVALFSGASGTGKTLAAGLVAGRLGVDAYQIDLSAVVSKYIGETEKHLARLFDAAEASGALLFFDEADALFGKRSEVRDAHDRYANVETSYLLQRLDAYDGVIVLASNFRRNMDEAFVRRMQFIVDFPLPEAEQRRQIWARVLPPELPREPDLDLTLLADRFALAGGNIRNIAVAAAFLAAEEDRPLAMRHLVAATRRELQKLGKVVGAGHFAGL